MRKGHTAIISNDRGHLKPDISRSAASPWGSFLGTWQTERRPIQLKTQTKLMSHLAATDDDSRHGSRASGAGSVKTGSRESERAGEMTGGSKPQSPTDGRTNPVYVHEPSQQSSKPPTPAPGDPRPGTGGTQSSMQGSVRSPAGSRVSSAAEGSRLQSPPLPPSAELCETHWYAASAPLRHRGSARPRTALAESHSRASGTPPQRPESRMGVGESGVQSPLGSRPPSSQFPLTTAYSSSRGPTAGTTTAGVQEAIESAHTPIEVQPASAALAQT